MTPAHRLAPGRLYVLWARADAPPVPEADLAALLSQAEQARAARFHFERDRRRYRIGTGWLRWVLGGVTGSDPAALRFERGPQDKPYLASGPSFNLSHSGELLLLGVAAEGRVGVDVEVERPIPELDALAGAHFSPAEVAELAGLPPDERARAFLRGWTRKEAFIKALGGGLSLPLDSFTVALAPGHTPALLSLTDPDEDVASWTVHSIDCDPSAEAAVAWDRPHGEVVAGDGLVG